MSSTVNSPSPQSAVTVCIKNLSKTFGKQQSLSQINLKIGPVGITGLLGRNAAGKTTLLKTIAGLLVPSEGSVQLWGKAPINNLTILQQLIYSHNQVPYSRGLKLRHILQDYLALYPRFDDGFAVRLLDDFSLDPHASYASLSQGEKSSFNYTAALATRAPLTMLDEPTVGMDVAARKHLAQTLIEEQNNHPRRFIIASHQIADFEKLFDEAVILDRGETILHSSTDDIRSNTYRITGNPKTLKTIAIDKNILFSDYTNPRAQIIAVLNSGSLASQASTQASVQDLAGQAAALQLKISAVSLEDYYLYLTQQTATSTQEDQS